MHGLERHAEGRQTFVRSAYGAYTAAIMARHAAHGLRHRAAAYRILSSIVRGWPAARILHQIKALEGAHRGGAIIAS